MTILFHLPMLTGSDLINGLVEFGHNVKAVENMQCLTGLLFDHLEIGFPHIRTHLLQLLTARLAEEAEKPQQRFGGSIFTDP